jgi:hypothetical protein
LVFMPSMQADNRTLVMCAVYAYTYLYLHYQTKHM